VDLLLGTDNYIPNGHIGDLCKEVGLWSFAYSYSSFNSLVLVWIWVDPLRVTAYKLEFKSSYMHIVDLGCIKFPFNFICHIECFII
jgi:hypothetical protein